MSNDPSPLEYMSTQSQETVAMEAALAARTADRTTRELAEELPKSVANAGSTIGDAANWAVDKAKDAVRAAAHQVRERATKAVTTYTREDPMRAILIAAGTGALLMVLVAMMARSGARSVTRRMRADR